MSARLHRPKIKPKKNILDIASLIVSDDASREN